MAIGVRVRFEVFKRDGFQCRYCGKRSPEVVLEVDHVVPRSDGGSDDPINLVTACWACNSGKSDKPLSEVITGEDPHDRAILLLEQERQLREYNAVLEQKNIRIERDAEALREYWPKNLWGKELSWLLNALEQYPAEAIRWAMGIAIRNGRTSGMAYVHVVLKNWAQRQRDAVERPGHELGLGTFPGQRE